MSDISDKQIQTINIEDEMRQSYLDYAMSVIVGRALPDVRDGLKPVHRRVLFAMSEINNAYNRPYLKSARIVGDVIGKYHPHGDSAVYETIVRMAQDFSLRYLLVDGQGNFGSVDGDSAAAMRYTEIRMQRMAHQLMEDLEKDTVDFVPNYDGTLQIPEVFPTRIPNLLVNGSSGIAVGMATNIPPHNLNEVIDGCLAVIDNPEITIDELIEFIPGPDFPTGAIINGRAGIIQAYRTGRGRIYIRAKADIEENKKGKQTIIVHELPYQLNKARLIEKIADLVKEKKIEGISELRDESDKDGMRIVIEIRRDAVGEVVLNNLYAQTQLQNVFGINIVALVAGQPKLLNLKQLLTAFVTHRREVVTRRTVYLLRKAREKGHILEGQAVALSNIDEVIALIKASASPADAKDALLERAWASAVVIDMLQRAGDIHCRPDELEEIYGLSEGKYYLSPGQAQSILEMRLNRLTSMEQDKLLTDYSEVLEHIAEYTEILGNSERLLTIIREELAEVKENFGDERRSEIVSSQLDLTMEDLITEEDLVVTISHGGYAKTQPISAYQAQRRGGTGKTATSVKDEDFVEQLMVANSHDTILCFSNLGKVYWLRVFHIPQAGRNSRGRPMVNLLNLDEGERVTSILPVSEYSADKFIFMATAKGTVKKTPLTDFSRPRSVGLRAVELNDDDTLVGTAITTGDSDIMLVSSSGKALRFKESDVRAMGRTARGVRGMRIAEGQSVIALIIPEQNGMVLSASQRGYGKRTLIEDFPVYGRGGQGVIAMQTSDRNGPLVGAKQVFDGDEIMLISDKGTLVRTHTEQISVLGRNTQGVTLIKLRGEENLVGLERLDEPEATEEDEAIDEATEADSATANSPDVESSETDSSEAEQSSDESDMNDAGDADAADDAPEDKQD